MASIFVAEMLESKIISYLGTFGSIGLAFMLGIVAISLAAVAKLRGAWAVVGLITGLLSSVVTLAGGIWLASHIR